MVPHLVYGQQIFVGEATIRLKFGYLRADLQVQAGHQKLNFWAFSQDV